MTVTSLKRKKLKNRNRAKERQTSIKQLTSRPPVKKVDVEEIKATFNKEEGASKEQAKDQAQDKE